MLEGVEGRGSRWLWWWCYIVVEAGERYRRVVLWFLVAGLWVVDRPRSEL